MPVRSGLPPKKCMCHSNSSSKTTCLTSTWFFCCLSECWCDLLHLCWSGGSSSGQDAVPINPDWWEHPGHRTRVHGACHPGGQTGRSFMSGSTSKSFYGISYLFKLLLFPIYGVHNYLFYLSNLFSFSTVNSGGWSLSAGSCGDV